jgi:hypothetical protein
MTLNPTWTGLAYFANFELGRGMIFIVALRTMRTHFGPGPRTAVLGASLVGKRFH